MTDAEKIEALEARLAALEARCSELDNRTSGLIRFGPRPAPPEEERRAAVQRILDTMTIMNHQPREA